MQLLQAIELITNKFLRLLVYLAGVVSLVLMGTWLIGVMNMPPLPIRQGMTPAALLLVSAGSAVQLAVSAALGLWLHRSSRVNMTVKVVLFVVLGFWAVSALLMPLAVLVAGRA